MQSKRGLRVPGFGVYRMQGKSLGIHTSRSPKPLQPGSFKHLEFESCSRPFYDPQSHRCKKKQSLKPCLSAWSRPARLMACCCLTMWCSVWMDERRQKGLQTYALGFVIPNRIKRDTTSHLGILGRAHALPKALGSHLAATLKQGRYSTAISFVLIKD